MFDDLDILHLRMIYTTLLLIVFRQLYLQLVYETLLEHPLQLIDFYFLSRE